MSELAKWSKIIEEIPIRTERQTYSGKTMDGKTFVQAVQGGYAPVVTIKIDREGCHFNLYLDEGEAAELGKMLLAAAASLPNGDHAEEVK
jgi:hypothetical protein